MEYSGGVEQRKVLIVARAGHWAQYFGQTCDALLYDGDVMPQLNTEQLTPPLPKWQSIKRSEIEVLMG